MKKTLTANLSTAIKALIKTASLPVLAMTAMALPAKAHGAKGQDLAWVCSMEFAGKTEGVQFLIGRFKSEAIGVLRCLGSQGAEIEQPIRITIQNKLLAPAIGAASFEFEGAALEVSLLHMSPEVLFGDYWIGQGQLGVGLGLSLLSAVKVGVPQLALQLAIQVNRGVGAHIGFNRMRIEPLN